MKHLVEQLEKKGLLSGETLALDAAFIKAYSRRDPQNNSRGLSDSEAGLRKQVLCRITLFFDGSHIVLWVLSKVGR
jgi:hypothetical protein